MQFRRLWQNYWKTRLRNSIQEKLCNLKWSCRTFLESSFSIEFWNNCYISNKTAKLLKIATSILNKAHINISAKFFAKACFLLKCMRATSAWSHRSFLWWAFQRHATICAFLLHNLKKQLIINMEVFAIVVCTLLLLRVQSLNYKNDQFGQNKFYCLLKMVYVKLNDVISTNDIVKQRCALLTSID